MRKPNRKQGSVLLATLAATGIIGVTLGSFLLLVSSHHRTVVRSQHWNAALTVAEAGVEEALAQLNPGVITVPVDRTANGWGSPTGGFYGPRSRALAGAGNYTVTYTDDEFPVIYSTGYVAMPTLSATFSRAVRVATTNMPLFNVAFAARYEIRLNGSGVSSDSYNSADPAHSDNGLYPAAYPDRILHNGDVACVYGPVSLGNHVIDGSLFLGPTAPFNGLSSQVTGGVSPNFNQDFGEVIVPSLNWLPAVPANTNIDGIVYKYALRSSGDYQIGDSGSLYVGPGAKVRLKVTTQNFLPAALRVAGTGVDSGSLTLYMVGQRAVLPTLIVDSGNAANFWYYGAPSNTSLALNGETTIIACVYAPSADLSLNGGGSEIGVVGSFIVKTLTMNGHLNFHYDENLRTAGPKQGYYAAGWREL